MFSAIRRNTFLSTRKYSKELGIVQIFIENLIFFLFFTDCDNFLT